MKLGSFKKRGAPKRRGSFKKLGKRSLTGVVVVLAAAAVVLVAYELQGSSDDAATTDVIGPPPVAVRVLAAGSFQSAHPFSPYYVVPDKRVKSPSQLTDAARNRFFTRPEAALAKGGQAGSPQIVRLALRATTADPVTVDGVSFVVVSSARPLKGWFTAQPSCDVAKVGVAKLYLDSKRGRVRYRGAQGGSARKLSLVLHRTRPTVIELQAATTAHRVAWTARLSITHKGRAQTITVDDAGAPFRVTSARSSRGYAPEFGATGINGFARDRGWDRGRIKGC